MRLGRVWLRVNGRAKLFHTHYCSYGAPAFIPIMENKESKL